MLKNIFNLSFFIFFCNAAFAAEERTISEKKTTPADPIHRKKPLEDCPGSYVRCYSDNSYDDFLGTVGPFSMHYVYDPDTCSVLTAYYCCEYETDQYNIFLPDACTENGYPDAQSACDYWNCVNSSGEMRKKK